MTGAGTFLAIGLGAVAAVGLGYGIYRIASPPAAVVPRPVPPSYLPPGYPQGGYAPPYQPAGAGYPQGYPPPGYPSQQQGAPLGGYLPLVDTGVSVVGDIATSLIGAFA